MGLLHLNYPLCVTQYFEHFRCLIVDVLPIISDWVFSLRKIFDQYELLKEKLQKTKEKETSRKKGEKKVIYGNLKVIQGNAAYTICRAQQRRWMVDWAFQCNDSHITYYLK